MKNRGFTLIELLAVIVILAVIALIATPIIINIINDVKAEAKLRSKENVFTSVKYAYTVVGMGINGGSIEPTLANIAEKIEIENATVKVDKKDNPSKITIETSDGVVCYITGNNTDGFVIDCGDDFSKRLDKETEVKYEDVIYNN